MAQSSAAAQAVGPDVYPLERRRFVVLGLWWLGSVLFWISWFIQAPILVSFWGVRQHVGFGTAEYLMSAVNLAGIATALLAGHVFDRLGPRRATLLCFGIVTVGFGLRPLAVNSFPLMLTLTVIAGLGGVPSMVAAPAVVAQWFGRHRMTFALSVSIASFATGQAVGLLAGAPMVDSLGPAWTFGTFSLALVAACVAWLLFVPEKPARPAGPPTVDRTPLLAGLREVSRARGSWLIFAIAMVLGGISVFSLSLFPGLLGATFGLDPALAGDGSTAMPVLAIAGLFLLGFATRRTRDVRRPGLWTSGVLLACWLAFTLAWWGHSAPLGAALLLIGVLGFFFQPCFSFAVDALEHAPGVRPATSGTAAGFYFTGVGIGGYVLPTVLAHFVQVYGNGAGVAGLLVLMAVLAALWLAVRALPRGAAVEVMAEDGASPAARPTGAA